MDSNSGHDATRTPSDSPFEKAVDDFLAEKQRTDSRSAFIKALESSRRQLVGQKNGVCESEASAQNLREFIQQLGSRKVSSSRGFKILDRLNPFIQRLTIMMKQCEQLVQAAPLGVAIAFAGVRVVLELASSVHEYMDTVVEAMDEVGGLLDIYNKLSHSLPDIRQRLVNSYKRIINLWYQMARTLEPSRFKGIVMGNILKPLNRQIKEALSDLERDLQVNMGHVQAEQIHQMVVEGNSRLKNANDKLRADIRAWVSGHEQVDPRDDYYDQLDRRHEGTCTWIMEDVRFNKWKDAKNNSVLWYNAPPGSGKTVLASSVIKHLIHQGSLVAYFFYSFSDPLKRHEINGLRSLALTLLSFLDTISDKMIHIFDRETQLTTSLNSPVIAKEVVHELVNRCNEVYIVIDGIDECMDEIRVLNRLEDLIQMPTLGTVKWFFTSRNQTEIRSTMDKLNAIEICPELELISQDIRRYLSAEVDCDKCFDGWEDCGNNFLYAKYVRETLRGLTCEEDIQAALNTFPGDLNKYYVRSLEKIARRSEQEQEVARRIFLILVAAEQSISLNELVDALAIRPGAQDYNASRVPRAELIETLCGPLLVFDKRRGGSGANPIIKFFHKTVEEFLLQDPDTITGIDTSLSKFFMNMDTATEEMGMNCVTYLSYARYKKQRDVKALLRETPKQHAFLRYAATFWFQHLRENSAPETRRAVIRFLGGEGFWNCLRIQSYEVPYLFGRFHSHRRGRFIMRIKGLEWGGMDAFGVPLPEWLDESANGLLLDRSFCSFLDEWREVLITCPDGMDLCVPLRQCTPSCHLTCLAKTKKVWATFPAESLHQDAISELQLLNVCFSGKLLWADLFYRKKDLPGEISHMHVPLFSRKAHIQSHNYEFPTESSKPHWNMSLQNQEGVGNFVDALNIDPQTLNVRRTTQNHSESYRAPPSFEKLFPKTKHGKWEILSVTTDSTFTDRVTKAFHVGWRYHKAVTHELKDDESDSWDSSSSVHSGGEESHEDSNDGYYDDEDEVEEEEEHDTTLSDTADENSNGTSDTVDYGEDEDFDEKDCLIFIIPNGRPFWTEPWMNSSGIGSRVGCAVHANLPLVAFTHTASRLELVDLGKELRRTLSFPEVLKQENPSASIRELRFSSSGRELHFLSISFTEDGYRTMCHLAVTTFKFSVVDEISIQASGAVNRCEYVVGDRLVNIPPPLALTCWGEDDVVVALPPLTCDPKIVRVTFPGATSTANEDSTNAVQVLRDQVYFPTSTPARNARLLYRSEAEVSNSHLYLALSEMLPGQSASSSESSSLSQPQISEFGFKARPPVVLKWKIPQDGWRVWSTDSDRESSDIQKGMAAYKILRGSFAENEKEFSVPIRCGLDWNAKSFLSCF